MRKPTRLVVALLTAGVVGTLGLEAYVDSKAPATQALSWIGQPFCSPLRSNPQIKTFFRLAMAQSDASAQRKTEVGPFSNAIPDAASIANADANPVLDENLGAMRYGISTSNALAQRYFDQGLRLAFAFNHLEAVRAFRKARDLDPQCGMCFWGEALVLGPNINAWMDEASVKPAFAAIGKARALMAQATAKERALIDALSLRYSAEPTSDRAPLDMAYAQAMQRVAGRFPTDDQIQALYAESLMNLQAWDYWEAGGAQPKGRTAEIMALLERILKRNPDHPGAIHFYIHMTEASSDPGRALPHARRLGRLMPGAGHLVHMPFHTFFRVGLYKEAVEANRYAVMADEDYIRRNAPVGIYPQAYYPHNVHSLLISAQMAGDGDTVIESAQKLDRVVSDEATRNISWVQPIKAAPYFAHAQFSAPETLVSLPDPGSEFPYVRGMWHYARGVGMAAQGDSAGALGEARAISALGTHASLDGLEAGGVPARKVLELATHVIHARLAQQQKDYPQAVGHFQQAVALEDALPYSEPPYWYYPTRQSLGAMQILAGDLDGAEASFRASLARTPNNGWSLYGLSEIFKRRNEAANLRATNALIDKAWLGKVEDLSLHRL